MGKQYRQLPQKEIAFIKEQKLFFIASSSGKEVNLSPKGYDSIRVLDPRTLLYLDYPGSGNRTYRDATAGGEFTILFNAFEGKAKILRIFAKGEPIEKGDARFGEYLSFFDVSASIVRRLFLFHIYAVETSCGDGVPIMRFEKERESLRDWAKKMDQNNKLTDYIRDHHEPPKLG